MKGFGLQALRESCSKFMSEGARRGLLNEMGRCMTKQQIDLL